MKTLAQSKLPASPLARYSNPQLLLSSPSDSMPSLYSDLFCSTNCHALLKNNNPILPPAPIPSWQSFHELVVRPNRSVKPPSTTMSIKQNRENAGPIKTARFSSRSLFQSSAAQSKPKPSLRPNRQAPASTEPHIIRLSSLQHPPLQPQLPSARLPPPLTFAPAHSLLPPLMQASSAPEWALLRLPPPIRSTLLYLSLCGPEAPDVSSSRT